MRYFVSYEVDATDDYKGPVGGQVVIDYTGPENVMSDLEAVKNDVATMGGLTADKCRLRVLCLTLLPCVTP